MKLPARAAIMVLALLGQLVPAAAVLAAEPIELVFSYTAAEQQFEVPEGVDELHVTLIGGKGANTSQTGGSGALVEGDLVLAPGTILFVEVGGNGSGQGGGFNGGASAGGIGAAGGGGALDIRTLSRFNPASLDSRLMVAAGGGGAGNGNNGGNAGAAAPGPTGGQAGTATSGGAGGDGFPRGGDGTLGAGGAGGAGIISGAGGGGGLFGGGGGGQSDLGGGGGGGGSSFVGTATSASVSLDATGLPSITITYTPGSVGGATVVAQVTVPTSAACLELSVTTIDFGTLPLGAVGQPAGPDVVVTNCSGVSATIFARGTDATTTGAAWAVTDVDATCAGTLGVDTYRLGLQPETGPVVQLSETNKAVQSLDAGASASQTALIDTACPGSAGAGETMTMQIVLLATEPAP